MKSPLAPVRSVLAAVARGPLADAPDAELLRRFAADRDEVAFAKLVHRYGPLVWRVTRTTLAHTQAAEDVFQATFLTLAKHAAAVRDSGALAGWLHRTAYRAAVRARRNETRPTLPLPQQPVSDDPLDRLTARELLAAVDEEIEALPEALRAAVVLCGVEGLSQEEAAKRLGWSPGSVKGRLERARAKLRRRLDARGLAVPAVLTGVGAVPSELVASTLEAVRAGEASPAVAKLVAENGMTSLFWWKPAIAAGLALTLAVGGLMVVIAPGRPRLATPRAAAAPVPDRLILWSATWPHAGHPNPEHKFYAMHAAWTPDGRQILTPGGIPRHGEVRIWDAANGRVAGSLSGDTFSYAGFGGPANPVAVSSDGRSVAVPGTIIDRVGQTANRNYVVHVWDRATPLEPRLVLDVPEDVTALHFDPTGKTLFTLTRDSGYLAGWDVATGRQTFEVRLPPREGPGGTSPAALGFACHPGGKLLAVAQDNRHTSFWDPATGKHLNTVETKLPFGVMCLTFSPDGKTLILAGVVGDDSLPFAVWDVTPAGVVGARRTITAQVPSDPEAGKRGNQGMNQMSITPDGRMIALACHDKTVRLLDLTTEAVVAVIREHTGRVETAAFSPDGKRLLTAGQDAVKVWSVAELLKRKPK